MIVFPRRLLAFLMGVACVVLGVIVLVSSPADETDLLAGAALAAGVAIVVLLAPDEH